MKNPQANPEVGLGSYWKRFMMRNSAAISLTFVMFLGDNDNIIYL